MSHQIPLYFLWGVSLYKHSLVMIEGGERGNRPTLTADKGRVTVGLYKFLLSTINLKY